LPTGPGLKLRLTTGHFLSGVSAYETEEAG
jgi:hypothetical protein